MDSLLGWFDLNAPAATTGLLFPIGPAGGEEMPLAQQLALYLVVVAGVILSEAVAMARRGESITVKLSWPWLLVACLVALVVFPAVWREIGAMNEASLLAQMGLAAQGGVFWGVVMAGAEKGTGSVVAASD